MVSSLPNRVGLIILLFYSIQYQLVKYLDPVASLAISPKHHKVLQGLDDTDQYGESAQTRRQVLLFSTPHDAVFR